jgi:tetratricopeptide (TPR) repeat protein
MSNVAVAVEPTLAKLQELLKKVLHSVRAGRFGPQLTVDADFVFAHADFFKRAGDELSFIRAHTLRWEVHDQAGEYATALRLLHEIARRHLADFQTADQRQFRLENTQYDDVVANQKLARQKVICCLGYGFALYRMGEYVDAERTFKACAGFLEQVLIARTAPVFSCWGTLARLHYFHGHLHRVQGEFVSARSEFVKALDCAYLRLEEKRLRKELVPPGAFHIEEQFANHCAGKVLGFGLGWTSLLQGKLSNASEQLQAARVVLNDSHDEHLKGQVEMLSCAVLSAQNGASAESEKLLERIERCCDKLRKHTEYYWQSQNEFAKTSVYIARAKWETDPERSEALLREARKRVEKFLRSGSGTNQVIANILLSRITSAQAHDRWSGESEDFARRAYKQAHETGSPAPVIAVAATALGEALGKGQERQKLLQALQLFGEAARRSQDSLVAQMACHLHLTEVFLKLGNIRNATESFHVWMEHSSDVEHKWLHQKAERLRGELHARTMYIVDFDDTRTFQELSNDIFRFLVDREILKQKREGKEIFDPEQAAKNLGVADKTFKQWQRKLVLLTDLQLQFHLPKKTS